MGPALACLLISLLMQTGANFANDLFDHERGSDTPDRMGPTRVTASGLISPARMRIGIVLVFGLAALLGFYLTWLRGWTILALGAAIILAALAYTGGPFPYGYYALGDVFVFLSFGLAAVCGTYYVQAGVLTPAVAWAAVRMGLLIINILVVNKPRDINTDAAARKHTLAVYLGRRGMLYEYLICLKRDSTHAGHVGAGKPKRKLLRLALVERHHDGEGIPAAVPEVRERLHGESLRSLAGGWRKHLVGRGRGAAVQAQRGAGALANGEAANDR